MSLLRFDRTAYLDALGRLRPLLRATFAATAAERLLTTVTVILERTRPEGLATLRAALDDVWAVLSRGELNRTVLTSHLKRSEQLIPDFDREPPGPGLVQLDDAAQAVYYTVNALLTGNTEDAMWAADQPCATLEVYIEQDLGVSWDGARDEDPVSSHPLMQAELRRQKRDLEELLALTVGPNEMWSVVKTLRERAKQEGRELYGPLPPGQ